MKDRQSNLEVQTGFSLPQAWLPIKGDLGEVKSWSERDLNGKLKVRQTTGKGTGVKLAPDWLGSQKVADWMKFAIYIAQFRGNVMEKGEKWHRISFKFCSREEK